VIHACLPETRREPRRRWQRIGDRIGTFNAPCPIARREPHVAQLDEAPPHVALPAGIAGTGASRKQGRPPSAGRRSSPHHRCVSRVRLHFESPIMAAIKRERPPNRRFGHPGEVKR
jgi:hypothetical protein